MQEQTEGQSAEGEQNLLSQTTPDIDFKVKFAEIKQHARVRLPILSHLSVS